MGGDEFRLIPGVLHAHRERKAGCNIENDDRIQDIRERLPTTDRRRFKDRIHASVQRKGYY